MITCLHAHCEGLCTWDFIALMEQRIEDGDAALPDGYNSFSELLCDPMFYPANEGAPIEIHPSDYGVTNNRKTINFNTAKKVDAAFNSICDNPDAGDDDFIEIISNVELSGNKSQAVKALNQNLKAVEHYSANDIASLKKRAKALTQQIRQERELVTMAEETSGLSKAANNDSDLANPSMDIADPLGDTLPEALATLRKRWRPISIGGKFRVLRVPDPERLAASTAVIESMSKDDFVLFHADRLIKLGDEMVNAAEHFVKRASRMSSLEFSPPPNQIGANTYNLYRGSATVPVEGDCEVLKGFVKHSVCRGREDLFRFVWLYLAHLVQRPGEKPQTAIVLRGLGGCGKSTFGLILERLAAPYCLTISEEEHITGRFAGQHLATSTVAICTEALFAGNPKVNGKIKSLVTSDTIMVEPKGLPAIQMNSYTRLFFDSNNDRVVPIDGNGSERRYLVMEINDDHQNDASYFGPIYECLNGDGIQALAWELMHYNPATDGLSWSDLRTAPETPERRKMRSHSMRPVERALIRMFEDGEVIIKTESSQTFRYSFTEGGRFRVPQAELRRHLAPVMNRHDAKDGDLVELIHEIVGETLLDADGTEHATIKTLRGAIECEEHEHGTTDDDAWTKVKRQGVRCFEFAPTELILKAISTRYEREEPADDQ